MLPPLLRQTSNAAMRIKANRTSNEFAKPLILQSLAASQHQLECEMPSTAIVALTYVVWSVCVLVLQHGQTDRDVFWSVDKELCTVLDGVQILYKKRQFRGFCGPLKITLINSR